MTNLSKHLVEKQQRMQNGLVSTASEAILPSLAQEDRLSAQTTAFILALTLRSTETGEHTPRVWRLCLNLGRVMGLSPAELWVLKYATLLHDIGKLGIPDAILHKKGKLTPDEWVVMKKHPMHSGTLLRAAEFPEAVCQTAEQHHERADGFGYPKGLMYDEIRTEARVFSVADAYDAITSDRCYRAKQTHEAACKEIFDWKGDQFDPQVVNAFLAMTREEMNAAP
jgi:putative nucleotidyltransferase with HDIG domain